MVSLLKQLTALVVLLLFTLESAYAGPGGKIASVLFDTPWGKVILIVLTICFAPLIVYMQFKEYFAVKRASNDLRYMASYSDNFDWFKLQLRVKECFFRIHMDWDAEDLSNTSEWMTSWYWQNQQKIYLDRWQSQGLKNVCKVKRIISIKPLLFKHRNHENNHEDSTLSISVKAYMQDYLQEKETGKIVEGNDKFKDVETIWTFVLQADSWRVVDIEEDAMLFEYLKEYRKLPKIEETIIETI